MRVTLSLVLAVGIAACGVAKPDYVPYEQKKTSTGTGTGTGTTTDTSTGTATECAGGLTAFTANVSPAVTTSCGVAGCHKTGAGSVTLVDGSDAANRKSLLAYTGKTADKVIAKLALPSHPGGAGAKAALPDAKIQAWSKAEAACP